MQEKCLFFSTFQLDFESPVLADRSISYNNPVYGIAEISNFENLHKTKNI